MDAGGDTGTDADADAALARVEGCEERVGDVEQKKKSETRDRGTLRESGDNNGDFARYYGAMSTERGDMCQLDAIQRKRACTK